jgi:hypothetical protein
VPTDPTTGTYGNINRANFTFWRPQLQDPAVTPTADHHPGEHEPALGGLHRGTDKPSFILSDNVLYTMYQGSMQPIQRFTDPATADGGLREPSTT